MPEPSAENPFKKALEPLTHEEAVARRTPFAKEPRKVSLTKLQQTRTVAELNLVDPAVLERTPNIRDLTVRDLNDLAAEFAGVPTSNQRVAQLSLEDISDLEGVFYEFKVAAGRDIARTGVEAAATSVDISCCCCTPCCCCAATDLSHPA
jgi:hypothetical protein